MKKNRTAAIISVAMAFVMTACGQSANDGTEGIDTSKLAAALGKVWVDSDLQDIELEGKEIRLQDDFAAAANKEWKLQIGDRYSGALQEIDDAKLAKMKKAVTDESIPGEEAEVLRNYYALSSDWDYRNSQGVEPLRPYIEDIDSINSIDELYEFFGDLQRNPLAFAPINVGVLTTYHTEKYKDENLVAIDGPGYSLTGADGQPHYEDLNTPEGLELYERVENSALYMLRRLGYSDKEAKKKFRNCVIWEKSVSLNTEELGLSDLDDYTVEWDKAVSMTGSFPLDDIMKSWGFSDVLHVVINPRYAKKLSSICSSSNLQKIKDYLIVNYCLEGASYLDREAYDTLEEFAKSKSHEGIDTGKTDEQIEDELQFDYYIGQTSMIGAMNKVYVENYFDDSTTSDLIGLTEDCIGALGDMFEEEEWLSAEGKKLCKEKLSNIMIHVAYQNFEILNYSKAPFLSKEEGGSFLDAYMAASRYSMYHQSFLAKRRFDRDFWDPVDGSFSTTTTNAMYNPATNGIYICAGICEPNCYSVDMTYEEKLAGISTVVGHELTHGFDKTGAQYDKDGLKNSWLPYEDQIAFNDKTDKVGIYYTTLRPYQSSGLYDGTKLTGEATADMGGLKITLKLAAKAADFDYDLYFRSFARLWRTNVPLEVEKSLFAGDPHPLAFYRINVGLQQFDEFYETYGIKEGDGMYLAPEKRIKVW
ncbi:MAG: M13 family metallopeptidase [Butyrivibrio sp.]|nr:M13 family metallopeptidase [Butyrivibrio sp.]